MKWIGIVCLCLSDIGNSFGPILCIFTCSMYDALSRSRRGQIIADLHCRFQDGSQLLWSQSAPGHLLPQRGSASPWSRSEFTKTKTCGSSLTGCLARPCQFLGKAPSQYRSWQSDRGSNVALRSRRRPCWRAGSHGVTRDDTRWHESVSSCVELCRVVSFRSFLDLWRSGSRHGQTQRQWRRRRHSGFNVVLLWTYPFTCPLPVLSLCPPIDPSNHPLVLSPFVQLSIHSPLFLPLLPAFCPFRSVCRTTYLTI